MPKPNEACTRREIVAESCRLVKVYARRSKSVATSLMLCAKAKTRQLLCDCSGALRTPSSQVCRAGGIEPYESVCQRHFNKIRREEDRKCS